jgi:hypothetical protein
MSSALLCPLPGEAIYVVDQGAVVNFPSTRVRFTQRYWPECEAFLVTTTEWEEVAVTKWDTLPGRWIRTNRPE